MRHFREPHSWSHFYRRSKAGDVTMATNALQVVPDSELTFTLTRTPNETPKATLTLTHPGTTDESLAFKVKTTQPRRYLVRPNQGLIAPGGSDTVSIILVEKDKNVLLQSYDRLGQSALDHSKDKFLVQSVAVSADFSKQYQATKASKGNSKEVTDALTSMWNAVSSSGTASVYNKKLHVKLQVLDGTTPASPTRVPQRHDTPMATIENMTPEQMFQEITTLRRKYDELVAFSVNLTAERDILNNTLEQTKRDLNREMAARAALETSGGGTARGGKKPSFVKSMFPLLIVAIAAFLGGVKMTTNHQVGFLESVPVIGPMVLEEDDTGSKSSSTVE